MARVIIAGGRDYRLTDEDKAQLDYFLGEGDKDCLYSEVVTGGATGVDTDALFWARSRGLATIIFAADWDKHGKAAGPIRNRAMAEYADGLIVFPGGRGTANMVKEAKARDLPVLDLRGDE